MVEEEHKELHQIAREVGLFPKTTALDIGEKAEGVLCYSVWFVSGIIFLIIEKNNKFVRFHALQSIATFLPLYIFVSEIEKIISMPIVGLSMNFFTLSITAILLSVLWLLIAILWLLLMYKASKGEKYKIPIVGRIAEKYA
jgi:uncharacterized membrane protein